MLIQAGYDSRFAGDLGRAQSEDVRRTRLLLIRCSAVSEAGIRASNHKRREKRAGRHYARGRRYSDYHVGSLVELSRLFSRPWI